MERMTVLEIEKILGDRVRISLKEDLTAEERAEENEQTALILGLAKQFINGADLVLRHEALQAKCKGLKESNMSKLIGEFND